MPADPGPYEQQWALNQLKAALESGEVFHDGGKWIRGMAKMAGVQVVAVHVDLTTRETNYYTVTAKGGVESHVL